MSDLVFQLASPYPASSLFFALRTARHSQQMPLRALYTLHKKWREAAAYTDQHQAVTTLNWWHHELEKVKTGEITHPALIALKPWLTNGNHGDHEAFFSALQGLLHGHMHWHHLTRVEGLAQLEPTIDAIGGSFAQAWLHIVGLSDQPAHALAAGRALWWIDQTRHIGHGLTPSRLWLPMSWLKELNLPAHLILKKDIPATQRALHGAGLMAMLTQQAHAALAAYNDSHHALSPAQKKPTQSLHALLKMRTLLLNDITHQPNDVWTGLVSVSPRKKWWVAIRS